MYKFVIEQGGCGKSAYDVNKAEKTANEMLKQGFELVHVYQSSTGTCAGSQSVLIMVFRQTQKVKP